MAFLGSRRGGVLRDGAAGLGAPACVREAVENWEHKLELIATRLEPAKIHAEEATGWWTCEDGSANVYADLGRPDADEMLIEAELVSRVDAIIK